LLPQQFSPPQTQQHQPFDPNNIQSQGLDPFGQPLPKRNMGGSPLQGSAMLPQHQQSQAGHYQVNNVWQNGGFDPQMAVDGQSPSDSWSTSSVNGQPVPSALNVEDW